MEGMEKAHKNCFFIYSDMYCAFDSFVFRKRVYFKSNILVPGGYDLSVIAFY